MKNWDYSKEKKTGSVSQTLLRGLSIIGIGLLGLAVLIAFSMGIGIAIMDVSGDLAFKWWHLIYWVIELLAVAFLIGKSCDDD